MAAHFRTWSLGRFRGRLGRSVVIAIPAYSFVFYLFVLMLAAPGSAAAQRDDADRRRSTSAPAVGEIVGRADATAEPSDADDAPRVDPVRAKMTLDEIGPAPKAPAPTSRPATPPKPAAERKLRTARDRMAERSYAAAIAALGEALAADPGLTEARGLLAQAAMQTGDLALAAEQLAAVLAERPDDATAQGLKGELALAENRRTEAIASFRAALALRAAGANDPSTLLVHLSLGLALKEEGYFRAAADEFEVVRQAMKSPPAGAKGYPEWVDAVATYRKRIDGLCGECRFNAEQYGLATQAIEDALVTRPGDAGLRRRLVLSLARSGHAAQAVELARALVTDGGGAGEAVAVLKEACAAPDSKTTFEAEMGKVASAADKPETLLRMARLAGERGDAAEEERLLERAIAADPNQADALYRLARIRATGDPQRFIDALVRAIRAQPANQDEIDACIQAAVSNPRLKRMIEEPIDRAADKNSKVEILYLLGALRIAAAGPQQDKEASIIARVGSNGPLIEGDAAIHEAFEKDPTFLPAAVKLFTDRIDLQDWEGASEIGEVAAKAGANSARLALLRGRVCAALDDFDGAQAAYLDSFAQDNKQSTALRELAEFADRRGDRQRCEELYRRIVNDVNPRDHKAREGLIRVYINGGDRKQARRYFDDFARLKATGPEVERCKALLQFTAEDGGDGPKRLERYRESLLAIARNYPRDVTTQVDIAFTYAAVGEYKPALQAVDAALAIDPSESRALELKASLQTRMLEFAAASETLASLTRQRPRNVSILEQLIESRLNEANFDAAAEVVRKLMARDDLADQRDRYGRLLIATLVAGKHQDQAVAEAKAQLDDDPDDLLKRSRYLRELGRAGKHDDAIAAAKHYLEKDPTDAVLRELLLARLDDAERFKEAEATISGWLAKSPDDMRLNEMLVLTLWRQKDWQSAIEIAEAGSERPDHRATYRRLLANTHLQAERYDEGIALFEAAAKKKPNEESLVNWMLALMQAERWADAESSIGSVLAAELDKWKKGLAQNMTFIVRLRGLLASVYQSTDRLDEAIAQLSEIRSIMPGDAESNNNLAYTSADAGRHLDDAEKFVRIALSQEPRNAAYLDTLGWVYYKRGEYTDATRWLRLAIQQHDEEDPVMLDHLADTLYRRSLKVEAAALWEKAWPLTDPSDERNKTRERKALRKALEAKRAAMRDGKPVPVAAIVDPTTASQPTTTQPEARETGQSPKDAIPDDLPASPADE